MTQKAEITDPLHGRHGKHGRVLRGHADGKHLLVKFDADGFEEHFLPGQLRQYAEAEPAAVEQGASHETAGAPLS